MIEKHYGATLGYSFSTRYFYKRERAAIAKIAVEKIGENDIRPTMTYCSIDDRNGLARESENLEELLEDFSGCAVNTPLSFRPPESLGNIFFDEENNVVEKYLPLEKEEQDKVIEFWRRKAAKNIVK